MYLNSVLFSGLTVPGLARQTLNLQSSLTLYPKFTLQVHTVWILANLSGRLRGRKIMADYIYVHTSMKMSVQIPEKELQHEVAIPAKAAA